MAKDYTDYIAMILDSGERVYHIMHIRNRKDINLKTLPWNGHHYVFNQDRAFRIKWVPWRYSEDVRKFERRKWLRPVRVLQEIIRSKKVGLLLYQEPCTNKCSSCPLLKADKDACQKIPDRVEPMHISRIHQPSGEMRG